MPPEAVLLKGKGEDRFIFARKQDYIRGRRRKDPSWTQYELIKSLNLSEPLYAALKSETGVVGENIEKLTEFLRSSKSSIEEMRNPLNKEIDKMYKGTKLYPPEHL